MKKSNYMRFAAPAISKVLPLMLIPFLLVSCQCNDGDRNKSGFLSVPESKLPFIRVKIKRFEKALFNLDEKKLQEELKRIQSVYYFFLDADLDDPENIEQMRAYINDPVIREFYDGSMKKYPDLSSLERELASCFSYYKYWFPEEKTPKVYTYVSGGDFELPVKYTDSLLIVALDMYLGDKFRLYNVYRVPAFRSRCMDAQYIARDCMEEIGITVCASDQKTGNFLDQMISMGKVYYFLDLTMPETPDSIKMKYSGAWLNWCKKNEEEVWSFFVNNKILYSSDRSNFIKFFSDGPFTSSFGNNSPARIPVWIGREIIRSYMKEVKDADFKKLIKETDSQKILQASKYKPRK